MPAEFDLGPVAGQGREVTFKAKAQIILGCHACTDQSWNAPASSRRLKFVMQWILLRNAVQITTGRI